MNNTLATPTPNNKTTKKPDAPSRRILIVEDQAAGAELLGISLRRLGHTVVGIAANGKDALAIAERTHPDIILMDINLPGMDGIETARHLGTSAHSIIFTSGRYDDEVLMHARSLEGSTYLVKPFSPAQLKAAIEMAEARRS
jgi:CheY-like chemotaxis protein